MKKNKTVKIEKASRPKHLTRKTFTGVKNLGLDPTIYFYYAEDSDETECVEESEILVKSNLKHETTKQKLI